MLNVLSISNSCFEYRKTVGIIDSTLKQRAVIEFLIKIGEVFPTKIHDKLRGVYQEETMAISSIRRLRFRNGDDSASDKPRSGRPSSASTPEAVEKVNRLIQQNRRIRVRGLATQVGCSTGPLSASSTN